MKITVDIDESDLARIQKATGINTPSAAVHQIVKSYLQDMERKEFLRDVLDGKTDYSMTNVELEAMGMCRDGAPT